MATAVLLAVPAAEAKRKSKKAGEITGDLYQDNTYHFQVKIHDNWKPKIGKENDKVRLVLTQRNYGIPQDYLNAPDYTQIPQLIIYVDTSSLGAQAFIDSLTSLDYKSDQKGDILKEFEILNEPDQVPMQRTRLEIAGEPALMWKVQAKYMKEIQASASSNTGTRVRRSYGGAVTAVRIGSNIVLFYCAVEWEFFESVMTEVVPMLESFTVLEEEEEH
jgi:hypothetical protein